jgi:hypothetical protein
VDETAQSDWCFLLARRLTGESADSPLLTPEMQGRVLRLAREVAHGTERFNAPLAAFLAGRYVERRLSAGETALSALDEVAKLTGALLVENPTESTPRDS